MTVKQARGYTRLILGSIVILTILAQLTAILIIPRITLNTTLIAIEITIASALLAIDLLGNPVSITVGRDNTD